MKQGRSVNQVRLAIGTSTLIQLNPVKNQVKAEYLLHVSTVSMVTTAESCLFTCVSQAKLKQPGWSIESVHAPEIKVLQSAGATLWIKYSFKAGEGAHF